MLRGSQMFRLVQKKKAVIGDDVETVEVQKPVEKRNIPNILNLEEGEFLEECRWFLLGKKVEVAVSTARRVSRLVDNEIVHFNFPCRSYPICDEDMTKSKGKDPLEGLGGPMTRARARKAKEALQQVLSILFEYKPKFQGEKSKVANPDEASALPLIKRRKGGDASNFASNEVIGSKIDSHITREPEEVANDQVEQQQSVYNEVTNLINYIFAKLPDMWPAIESSHTSEVLSDVDALTFTSLYLQIIELLVDVWDDLLPAKRLYAQGMGKLEFKLGKLDRRVKELIRYVNKKSDVFINHTFKRLSTLYLRVESMLKESSALPSNSVVELGKVFSSTSINGASCRKGWILRVQKEIYIPAGQPTLCNRRTIYVNIFTGEVSKKLPKAMQMARGVRGNSENQDVENGEWFDVIKSGNVEAMKMLIDKNRELASDNK
ncbi:hypothetical protein HKD37_05G012724 [Glycine soja]|uniref:Uncharacterized protein n=1 Tax=Glycine soja TaxID=3848 RepID=A0A445KL96_GLYSO|nr:hypothetical protein D0Y65_011744 [Glycine soja]